MDIGDILSSLKPEDMQALQSVAASLMGSNTSSPPSSQAGELTPPVPNKNEASQNTGNANEVAPLVLDEMRMFGDIAGLLKRFGEGENDPRCKLIAALKPMLSKDRQKRADEAMRIIKLMDMIPALSESGLLKGVFNQ